MLSTVMTLRFVLNGEPAHVTSWAPHTTLLQWLRSVGLSGAKEGCAEGECGACAVALLGRDARGRPHYRAVNSCLLPLACVHGEALLTVEGVAGPNDSLHPVQRALVETGGSQCGYCTPGFVISLFCEYYRPGREGYDPEAISGNLCRCTGYRPIVDAARALAAPEPGDPHLLRLRAHAESALDRAARPSRPLLRAARPDTAAAPPAAGGMDGQVFASGAQPAPAGVFLRPASLAELFAALAAREDAVLLAGGTDLMVEVTQRARRFDAVISLAGLAELRGFACEPHEVAIGAGLPLSELAQHLHEQRGLLPMLEQLSPLFSSRLIRNRATLGGNLQTASPIGDAAPCLLALDAELVLASAAGERRIALCDFFTGYRATALKRGELIARVAVPRPAPRQQRVYKVSKRPLDDISAVLGAFALDLDGAGRIARLRIAYGGIAATPLRALAVEQLALGKAFTPDTLALLLPALERVGSPLSDHRGSAAYRRALTSRLLERFWREVERDRAQAAEMPP